MEENTQDNIEEITWKVPEFEKHERSKNWYIVAGLISVFLLIFALFTSNFLFAVIIVTAALITIIHDGKDADLVDVIIDDEGIIIGRKLYEYDDLKNFSVLFKPKENLKNLYFEFNNPAKQRLSVPLLDNNPLQIRDFLLKYISEDLERTNMPLSENLSKLLKI
ncbi:MAG: hypothetical protein PF572_06935 [Patescibacteria group bacterium]|jgi:hypothetical protein|nr:hypothetical protein [Patescibacteria group bacterium]